MSGLDEGGLLDRIPTPTVDEHRRAQLHVAGRDDLSQHTRRLLLEALGLDARDHCPVLGGRQLAVVVDDVVGTAEVAA